MPIHTEIINYYRQYQKQKKNNIRIYNWCHSWNTLEDIWFYHFLNSRKLVPTKKNIAFFSVFGSRILIDLSFFDKKILYTGENIHRNEHNYDFTKYENYGFDKGIDLALGFDYIKSEKYLRFPFWILYFIKPKWKFSDIKKFCDEITFSDCITRDKYASLVSSHDPNGIRKKMYNSLSLVEEISCGGKFLNNTNELKIKFNNNKMGYLKQFKFNICPENSNAKGYVTEKIFEAIVAGCIPVYWGSDNDPEPDILNKDAIIFWNKEGDNTSNINLIKELNSNEKLYKEFVSQPRLLPSASERICFMLDELENKISILLKN